MKKKYRLTEYSKLEGKNIFFDANVLIYLFWPSGEHSFEENYSRAFSKLLKQENKFFVDFIIVSEVVNRVLRLEYKKHLLLRALKPSDFSYKKFRNSQEGRDALYDAYLIIKENVLKLFYVAGKAFSKNELEMFLNVDELDFADKAIELLCEENNFVLFTNDSDFKHSNIEVLSGHPAFFKK